MFGFGRRKPNEKKGLDQVAGEGIVPNSSLVRLPIYLLAHSLFKVPLMTSELTNNDLYRLRQ